METCSGVSRYSTSRGDRALGRGHQGGVAPGAGGEVAPQAGRVAEGGRHEQEPGPRQLQQGNLPGPAPIAVAVVVELVHHYEVGRGVGACPQGPLGQDLRRAGDDGGIGVDRGVAGHHADRRRPEGRRQLEELLAHQGLDRGGVDGPATLGQHGERSGQGHQRLARACGRGQHHVLAGQQPQYRLLLVGIELQPRLRRPLDEGVQQLVGAGRVRQEVAECGQGHAVRRLGGR